MKSSEAFCSVCLGLIIGVAVLVAVESLLFTQYTLMQVSVILIIKYSRNFIFFNDGRVVVIWDICGINLQITLYSPRLPSLSVSHK